MLLVPESFQPRRFLSNGHLQTIAGNFFPRTHHLPPPTAELVEVAPASQVLCHCHWQPNHIATALTVIILHGLEGSSSSQYVLGNASKLYAAGCNVIRMNMRNCGGTEHLTTTLYHSGLSGDVAAVLTTLAARHGLTRAALVGYSMGGNLVLRLAGQYGPTPPPILRAVVGVSPAIDLSASATALHLPANRLYEWKFLYALLRRYNRKCRLFPEIYSPASARGVRTLRQFDDRITAVYSGFASAEDYYQRAAAAPLLPAITVPTLILHALDDPFIRLLPATRAAIAANPHITLLETTYGGHCAFLAQPHPPTSDGYWAESTLLEFLFSLQ